jgi:hypothetical protein
VSSSATAEASLTPKSGGSGLQFRRERLEGGWKGLGVVYVREKDGDVEICILYESHASQEIKDCLAAKFGVAAKEWKVTE